MPRSPPQSSGGSETAVEEDEPVGFCRPGLPIPLGVRRRPDGVVRFLIEDVESRPIRDDGDDLLQDCGPVSSNARAGEWPSERDWPSEWPPSGRPCRNPVELRGFEPLTP